MDERSIAQFFSRVVPWPQAEKPGVINLHWQTPEKYWSGRPFNSLNEFMGLAKWLHRNHNAAKEIYFCLSQQAQMGEQKGRFHRAIRNHENATCLKAIWLDVDVKEPPKGYASTDEAYAAIGAFIEAAKLPPPTALVASGGGVHVYWISDRPLPTAEWQSYADGLRARAEQHGLRCDLSVTVDSARILRVPGTFNNKLEKPRPVVLETLADEDINFSEALAHIQSSEVKTRPGPSRNLISFDTSAPVPFVIEGDNWQAECDVPSSYGENLDPKPIMLDGGCPFLQGQLNTGGMGTKQDLWMMTGLISTFLKDGRNLFHQMSRNHEDYQEANTDAMFDRKDGERQDKDMGWPHCATLKKWGAKECATCPHFGKIVSPLNLAKLPQADTDATVVFNLTSAEVAELQKLEKHLVGSPYMLDEKSNLICQARAKGSGGKSELVPVLRSPIYDLWFQRDPDGLRFMAILDQTGRRGDVFLSLSQVNSTTNCNQALSEQKIQINNSNKEGPSNLMDTFLGKLRFGNTSEPARVAVPYGWWRSDDGKEEGFAFDGKLYTPSGPQDRTGRGDKVTRDHYTKKGDRTAWFTALKSITDQHRPALEALVALSFAAPLMKLAGHKGGTLSARGPGAANKSSAVAVGLAVWGQPEQTKLKPSTSILSLQNTAGDLRNLPLYWDDVRGESKLKQVSQITNELTEGGTGGKMLSDGAQRAVKSWQTAICVTSNDSLFDLVLSTSKTDTAQVDRIFHINVEAPKLEGPGRLEEWQATPIFNALEENYGHIGHEYAQLLGEKHVAVKIAVSQEMERFGKAVNYRSQERFWLALCACIIVGATLANSKGATFNMRELELFLFNEYTSLRKHVHGAELEGGTLGNTEKVLSQFLKDMGEHTIRTNTVASGGRFAKAGYQQGPLRRDVPIHVQWVLKQRLLRFSRPTFTKYITEAGYTPSLIMEGLEKHFGMKTGKVNLAAGTPHNGAQEHILIIPVPHGSELERTMDAYTPSPSAALMVEEEENGAA